MAEHSYNGLYYPYIHFKQDSWLKLSALYWDRMGRIVPIGYKREDSSTVRELGDFVENLHPQWVTPSFGERFLKFVNQYGAKLRDQYDVDRVHEWPMVPLSRQPPKAGGSSGTDPRMSYVFFEKMTMDICDAMKASKIAQPEPSDSRWIGMHPRLADVYMTALAEQLARERGLYPLTDEAVDHVAVGEESIERLAQALIGDVNLVDDGPSEDVESYSVFVSLESVLPVGIEQLSVDRILQFRAKYPGERASFQERVLKFVKARKWLEEVPDEKVLLDRIESEFNKELKPELDALREKYRDAGIETAAGAMAMHIGVPAIIGKAALIAGFAANPVAAAAAGAALAVVPILRGRRKAKREIRSSGVSYLLRIERDLQPSQLSRWISKACSPLRRAASALP